LLPALCSQYFTFGSLEVEVEVFLLDIGKLFLPGLISNTFHTMIWNLLMLLLLLLVLLVPGGGGGYNDDDHGNKHI